MVEERLAVAALHQRLRGGTAVQLRMPCAAQAAELPPYSPAAQVWRWGLGVRRPGMPWPHSRTTGEAPGPALVPARQRGAFLGQLAACRD